MVASVLLLDLAVRSVEQWSHVRISTQGVWMAGSLGFLQASSFSDAHSEQGERHLEGDRILMDAIEAAVLAHAREHSEWWQLNKERLCFSHEGVLRYFAICGLGSAPDANVDLIGRIACTREMLESELAYEIGTLLKAAFVYLRPSVQVASLQILLNLHHEEISDARHELWALRSRAEMLSAIPCYLRSQEAEHMLRAYENIQGTVFRQPEIRQRGGWVGAPFSFEIFLTISDAGILRLLRHYSGYSSWHTDDFVSGGERQVGVQLTEATSRDPLRFLRLLYEYWPTISRFFREDIIEGATNHLAYRFGNLQANNNWNPVSEPDPQVLAFEILSELERHTVQWGRSKAASKGLRACSQVLKDTSGMNRIVFLSLSFVHLHEESTIVGAQRDLINAGANMARGNVVEALMILATYCSKSAVAYPELLAPTLRRFAQDEQPAIRALVLRRLPYLQSASPDFGWTLFDLALEGEASLLWAIAEPCLYYAYKDQFSKVQEYLIRLRNHEEEKALDTWGRISALSAFANCLDFLGWLDDLKRLDNVYSWEGAASVWTHHENLRDHGEQCFAGIEAGLSSGSATAVAVAKKVARLFNNSGQAISIPPHLIQRCFAIFETDSENKHHNFFSVGEWLNAVAHRDPDLALAAATAYLGYVRKSEAYLYDHKNNLTQLLTRLFAEAEEREGVDDGLMLRDVVALQDSMLSLGVNGIREWLGAAERP